MDHNESTTVNGAEEAASILGVELDADDETVRLAYVAQIKTHPPDIDPDHFERIRDAYALLSNPTHRARRVLMIDPNQPFDSLLEGPAGGRRLVGPRPWLEALRDRSNS